MEKAEESLEEVKTFLLFLCCPGEISIAKKRVTIRKEFFLTWDTVTEAGSVVVSDKIKMQLKIQFIKN